MKFDKKKENHSKNAANGLIQTDFSKNPFCLDILNDIIKDSSLRYQTIIQAGMPKKPFA